MIRAKRRSMFAAAFILVGAGLGLDAADAPPALVERTVKSLGAIAPEMWQAPILSADGGRVAYILYKNNESRVVCDEKPGPTFKQVAKVAFSGDGSRLAYAALRESTWLIVVDGQEKPGRMEFAFSPDGKHFAGKFKTPAAPEPMMVRDGKPEPALPGSAAATNPVFSPDSRHFAYSAGYPDKRFVMCDGRKGPEFGDVGAPVFSRDSRRLAYPVCQNNRWAVMCDGKIEGNYDEVGPPVFSPDGARLACRVRRADKTWVIGGKEKPATFEEVRNPVFSADGKRLAHAARNGKAWCVVCGDKKEAEYDDVGDPVFSPDSKHLAYRAMRGGVARVVCDGNESAPFDDVTWIGFSPDGKHIAFAAARGGQRLIVCDGLESPAHATVLAPERFADIPGKLRYVIFDKNSAGAGKTASLVEVDWPADRTWEDAFKAPVK